MATRTARDVLEMIRQCNEEIRQWDNAKKEWEKELTALQAECAHHGAQQIGRAAGTYCLGKDFRFRCPSCLKEWVD